MARRAAIAEASVVPPRTRMRMSAFSLKPDPQSRNPAPIRPWLTILGLGEDGRAGLSRAALDALERAEFVIGGARHLALVGPLLAQTLAWPSPFADGYPTVLARRGRPTCVLATGDPFQYGVGAELARLVPPDEILCLPQA